MKNALTPNAQKIDVTNPASLDRRRIDYREFLNAIRRNAVRDMQPDIAARRRRYRASRNLLCTFNTPVYDFRGTLDPLDQDFMGVDLADAFNSAIKVKSRLESEWLTPPHRSFAVISINPVLNWQNLALEAPGLLSKCTFDPDTKHFRMEHFSCGSGGWTFIGASHQDSDLITFSNNSVIIAMAVLQIWSETLETEMADGSRRASRVGKGGGSSGPLTTMRVIRLSVRRKARLAAKLAAITELRVHEKGRHQRTYREKTITVRRFRKDGSFSVHERTYRARTITVKPASAPARAKQKPAHFIRLAPSLIEVRS